MDLATIALGDAALRGIGRLLTQSRGESRRPGEEYGYWDIERDLGLVGPLSAGMLECYPREPELLRMERHLQTREYLVALEGETVVCLAPPQEPGPTVPSGLVALRMKAGQAIILEVGAWHWIPFPAHSKAARFQVIFRSGTGREDLFFHDLPESVHFDLS